MHDGMGYVQQNCEKSVRIFTLALHLLQAFDQFTRSLRINPLVFNICAILGSPAYQKFGLLQYVHIARMHAILQRCPFSPCRTPCCTFLVHPYHYPLRNKVNHHIMTSSNGNIFRVTGPLCGEFTGPRWIPRPKASDAELWCFLWSAPE